MRTSRPSERASLRLLSHGPTETRDMGVALGRLLKGAEVIHLTGGIGAGKTCFIQGVAAGLGIPGQGSPVSPTFTIINEYPGAVPLYHVDLYRLDGPEEVRRLGLEEYHGRGVIAVEWAERLPTELKTCNLDISLVSLGNEERTITITAVDREAAGVVRSLRRAGGHAPER